MNECSVPVLTAVVDFIYGIGIPEDFNFEDAKSLLAMADLYLMEDLKNAVGSLIATKHVSNTNILEISQMAEKYSAQKLKELCCEFIFKNHDTLEKEELVKLYEVLPLLGEKAWQELVDKERPQNSTDLLNKVLGINHTEHFKRRGDFQSDDDYKGYIMSRMKPNMLVLCNKASYWGGETPVYQPGRGYTTQRLNVPMGTIGRVLSFDMNGAKVKWPDSSNGLKDYSGSFIDLDLLTPPINTFLFND